MTVFKLKLIAITTMLIDHIGAAILMSYLNSGFLGNLYFISRAIGRIAFPIFAYLIANGCKHTKNINKYIIRLGILAIISEIPFDLTFIWWSGINFLQDTNVFYTLFLGAVGISIYEELKQRQKQWLALIPLVFMPALLLFNFIPDAYYDYDMVVFIGIAVAALNVIAAFCLSRFLPKREENKEEETKKSKFDFKHKIIPFLAVLPLLVLADLLSTDYSNFGVGLIILLYLANPANKITRTVILAAAMFYHYGRSYMVFNIQSNFVDGVFQVVSRTINWNGVMVLGFSLISAVLVFLYNNKPGKNSKAIQWAFYLFYPIHISLLAFIRFLL